MKYLSDKILVRYTIPEGTAYSNYSVYARDARGTYTTPIFTGRVFRSESTQTLYLNDIIKNYMYNPAAFKPNYDGSATYTPPINDRGTRMVSKFQVVFAYGETQETDWVLPYYKDANIANGPMKTESFNPENNIVPVGGHPSVYNPLEERTSLLPRIPRLTHQDHQFWADFKLIPDTRAYLDSQDDDYVFLFESNEGEEREYDAVHEMWEAKLWGESIYALTQGTEITMGQYFDPESSYSYNRITKKVANVDSCPAPYYLIWMDRTGAYQCQPFTKRVDFTESISTVNVNNMQGDERPYEKDVTPQWVLHTDWMSDDDHKAYESILTSPYIYLYDTENDLGWYVNCTDSSWTDKVYKNQKKMFYLTINLKAIGKQELVY